MINVFFFAQVRELAGCDSLTVDGPFGNVEQLRMSLAERNARFALALASDKLLAAVNQTLVSLDTPLSDGDEVAFFPPVTGG